MNAHEMLNTTTVRGRLVPGPGACLLGTNRPRTSGASPGWNLPLPVFILMFLCGCITNGMALETNSPTVFGLPPKVLAQAKARVEAGDKDIQPAFRKLIQDADKALKLQPTSVMDKTKPGASGDKHDYFSTAPYFWPDPAKPDGLPYIRRDGYKNPEAHNEMSDSPRLAKMGSTVHTLALAYYFTAKEDYAEHAARLIRVWFLDPDTKMNPNFNQAQAVPGKSTGRASGMIESRNLCSVMDAIGLLAGSKHWSKSDQESIQKWMADFLQWARTSKIGKAEQAAKNNHGSFYDMQTAHMALFTGQKDLARSIIESAKTNRIARQFKPDGSQPLELAREDSFAYSRFNLQALFDLAVLGDYVGIDVWRYESTEGASIRKGLDFLLPYVEDAHKEWPYEKTKQTNRDLQALLRQAWFVYRDELYLKALQSNPVNERDRDALFFPLK